MIPCFEPASQQEAYEMIGEAFDFSEKYQIPVLMRVTTRMAHSRAVVEIGEPRQQNTLHYPERPRQWILMPGNSRVRYKTLIEENKLFEQEAEHSRHNRYIDGPDKSMGIIACGLAYNYIMENFPEGCPFPVLKISQYPLPTALVQRMASECRSLLIVEEGQPLVEEMIRGLLGTPIPVKGRLSGELPRTGELTPDNVRGALGLPPGPLPGLRPPRRIYGTERRAARALPRPQGIQRHRLLYARFAAPVPGDRHLRGDGRFGHDGQGRCRRRTVPFGSRNRRLDLHPLGHDRPAGCRE